MANFISPFLPRILYVSCSLSDLISTTYPQIESKLVQLRTCMATLIPLRLLAPILNEHSNFAVTQAGSFRMTVKNIEYYMHMVIAATRNVNQEDLLTNIRLIRSMFMNLFDMRAVLMTRLLSKSKSKMNFTFAQSLSKYEDHIIDAFCELIFKLSEDLFKPIFFKLYEWATINEPSKDRLITFYRTTLRLSGKLKNLFVLFASQFLPNASATLDLLNSSKTGNIFSFLTYLVVLILITYF